MRSTQPWAPHWLRLVTTATCRSCLATGPDPNQPGSRGWRRGETSSSTRNAAPSQRLYLTYCAECHGANGHGSWRAALFLLRPGDLADPNTLAPLSDDYLIDLVKHGGAPIGKPGMPAFGYHLSDEQIREVVAYVRTLSTRR